MLKALLLDLGDTLVHDTRVIEHVPAALTALGALHVASGEPLPFALVSDYQSTPSDPDGARRLFAEYLDVVRRCGLLDFFEPVAQRITLSTQAGVRKPDAAIFRLALTRLGTPADLTTAMFVTENAAHVAAARALGMTGWQFGADITDWSQGPLIVAKAIGDRDPSRLFAAAALRVRVLYTHVLTQVDRVTDDVILAEVAGAPARWVEFARAPNGDIVGARDVEVSRQERLFTSALDESGALARDGEPLAPGQTHRLEPDPDGTPRPVRKRFSIT
jgi:hypothetical protein